MFYSPILVKRITFDMGPPVLPCLLIISNVRLVVSTRPKALGDNVFTLAVRLQTDLGF